jgi:hypothetical protein
MLTQAQQEEADRLLTEAAVSPVTNEEHYAACVERWRAVVAMRHRIQDERDAMEKIHRDALLAIQQNYNPLVCALRGREAKLKHEMIAYRGRALYSIPLPAREPQNGSMYRSVTAAIRRLFSRVEGSPWHSP